jgi:hypothetical protein
LLFLKLKISLKCSHFESLDNSNVTAVLKGLLKKKYFQAWLGLRNKCLYKIRRQVGYFAGSHILTEY